MSESLNVNVIVSNTFVGIERISILQYTGNSMVAKSDVRSYSRAEVQHDETHSVKVVHY